MMLAVVVFSRVTQALHPPSNVETIDPLTLHRGGEFAESNLGAAARVNPDLRASRFLREDGWFDILLKGGLQNAGMASFGTVLDHDGAAAIRAYVIHRATLDKQTGQNMANTP